MKTSDRPSISDLATAKVVRKARTAAGFSQEALADAAGLHRTYISLIERSRRSPTIATLDAIGRALDFEPSMIFRLVADTLDPSQVIGVQIIPPIETLTKESPDASK
jgi:transcriptional regulator with XRE-family HTH domain